MHDGREEPNCVYVKTAPACLPHPGVYTKHCKLFSSRQRRREKTGALFLEQGDAGPQSAFRVCPKPANPHLGSVLRKHRTQRADSGRLWSRNEKAWKCASAVGQLRPFWGLPQEDRTCCRQQREGTGRVKTEGSRRRTTMLRCKAGNSGTRELTSNASAL